MGAAGPSDGRRDTLLLLHHQPGGVVGCGGGVLCQRPLQPGEPGAAVEEWCPRLVCAVEYAGGELGLHGDWGVGLEYKSLAGVVAATEEPAAAVADDGVQEISGRSGLAAVSNRAYGRVLAVPAVAVESVGGHAVPGE